MSVPQDFIAAWRVELGKSSPESNSRHHKVGFLLAVEAGDDLTERIRQLGLYAAQTARDLGTQTREHLAVLGEGADNFRRELGALVPVAERP